MSSGPAVYRHVQRHAVVFYRDGVSSTVSVHRVGDKTFLRVNGKTDASTGADMPTQLISGHLPLLVHPEPESVLIIGMGSGVTAGAVTRYPVRRIDLIEIEPAVIEAAQFFAHANHDVLKDPRVRVVIADGRNFLMTTPERYDVIISEPSNPWIAGVASLFSLEHFEHARSRLKPGGLMLQWVQTYGLSPDDLRMIVRTFRAVFPAVSVWTASPLDLLLLGSAQSVVIEPAALAQRYAEHPGVRADLERVGVRHGAAVAGYLALGEGDIARLTEGTRLNTDDRLAIEFSAPRAVYLDTVGPNLAAVAAARQATPPAGLEEALDRDGGAEVRHALGLVALRRNDRGEAQKQFERALLLEPGHVSSALELADLAYRSRQWGLALRLSREVLARQDNNARANYLAGISSARLLHTEEAQRFLQRAVALEPGNVQYRTALARIP
jgi:spermidine synthase